LKNIFNKNKLDSIAKELSEEYKNNFPYPHCVIDNFFEDSIIEQIYSNFPTKDQIEYYKYDNPLEKKFAMDKIDLFHEFIQTTLLNFNSSTFLNFLERLTGIEGLIPDPYFRGGGVHKSVRGGKLDIHIDFNKHPKLNIERRINVLLYLNKDWKEEYNGDFQLWKGKKNNNKHELEYLCKKIYPIYNRLIIFSTSENSYHGFPEPILCPENKERNSLAWYYYTAINSNDNPHSTEYVKLPNVEDGLDELREQRKKGRLTSNIL